ncbi:hypothetical protein P171DRAFT_88098 [Karstenula rhodostoma CBS 690.94]|uniref:Uncharacterized protein n=1 Tax=Karstenula rhodostoma CBS 690.94 TaxID=1392251 RepID=A0A9P4U7C9_9PLEO|nr:hypothetical protein P171DRAFT_88098 [Karstenula rhodostoma CBS 690.94]
MASGQQRLHTYPQPPSQSCCPKQRVTPPCRRQAQPHPLHVSTVDPTCDGLSWQFDRARVLPSGYDTEAAMEEDGFMQSHLTWRIPRIRDDTLDAGYGHPKPWPGPTPSMWRVPNSICLSGSLHMDTSECGSFQRRPEDEIWSDFSPHFRSECETMTTLHRILKAPVICMRSRTEGSFGDR